MISRLDQPSSSSLCGKEVKTGVVSRADQARIGYLTIGSPLNYTYETNPQTYKSGLNHGGKIIGYNAKMHYPGEVPKYHDILFLRNVDWAGGAATNTTDPTPNCLRVNDCADGITESPDTKDNVELDEYFTADNDEGYLDWAARKSNTCEMEVKQKGRDPPRDCLQDGKMPKKSFADHHMPVLFRTTNQVYGSYTDLEPNYFCHIDPDLAESGAKNIRPRRMAVVKKKPFEYKAPPMEHFGYMNARRSSTTTYMNTFNHPDQIQLLGLRSRCHTFQVNSPTGLEMNRIARTNRSLFATMGQQSTRQKLPLMGKSSQPVLVSTLTVPYCPCQNDARTRQSTPGVMYLERKSFIR